jgi:putative ABC transport system substrate-binding protein
VKRRAFITLIGGAAAWPLAARAQQPGGMRRVGVLMPYPPTDAEMQGRVQALRQGLGNLGWRAGVNIQFDVRWTTDNMDLVRVNAAGLLELKPDVVVAAGGRVIPILMQLTRSVPIIVPGAGDPVVTGWAASLARPGGNVTGFTFFESSVIAKYLEILKQIVPGVSQVAAIYNPDNSIGAIYARLFETFAHSLAVQTIIAPVRSVAEIDRAIESLAQQKNGGAFFLPDLTTNALRDQVIAIVARHRVPAIYSDRVLVASGGLVSYDADRTDIYRRAASYVDRVLRGEKPRRSAVSATDQIPANDQSEGC